MNVKFFHDFRHQPVLFSAGNTAVAYRIYFRVLAK